MEIREIVAGLEDQGGTRMSGTINCKLKTSAYLIKCSMFNVQCSILFSVTILLFHILLTNLSNFSLYSFSYCQVLFCQITLILLEAILMITVFASILWNLFSKIFPSNSLFLHIAGSDSMLTDYCAFHVFLRNVT
jgi:hypothetical protein